MENIIKLLLDKGYYDVRLKFDIKRPFREKDINWINKYAKRQLTDKEINDLKTKQIEKALEITFVANEKNLFIIRVDLTHERIRYFLTENINLNNLGVIPKSISKKQLIEILKKLPIKHKIEKLNPDELYEFLLENKKITFVSPGPKWKEFAESIKKDNVKFELKEEIANLKEQIKKLEAKMENY